MKFPEGGGLNPAGCLENKMFSSSNLLTAQAITLQIIIIFVIKYRYSIKYYKSKTTHKVYNNNYGNAVNSNCLIVVAEAYDCMRLYIPT